MKSIQLRKGKDLSNKTNDRGITLIALVVTIIILLILAAVSLGSLFDANGLFSKANSATFKWNKAKEEEANYIKGIENYISLPNEDNTTKSVKDLKIGDYVNYIDNNGKTWKCCVIYDSTSEYGIQIMPIENVENVNINTENETGYTIIDKIYNKLNDEAKKYINEELATKARCLGSDPRYDIFEEGIVSNDDYISKNVLYPRKWGTTYTNTTYHTILNTRSDILQLQNIENLKIIQTSWYNAPYFYHYSYNGFDFMYETGMSRLHTSESWDDFAIMVKAEGTENYNQMYNITHGMKPVFLLREDLIITSGLGRSTSPYNFKTETNYPIDNAPNYVGCYADLNGNGEADGIIYADLNEISELQETSEGKTKEYYISKLDYDGPKGVKDLVCSKGEGRERFYVISLKDFTNENGNEFCWYDAAYTNKMAEYMTDTSTKRGYGRRNTLNMLAKWEKGEYGNKDNNENYKDIWGQIKEEVDAGWFIPSLEEWYDIMSYGFNNNYWTSSQNGEDSAHMARLTIDMISSVAVNSYARIILSKAF